MKILILSHMYPRPGREHYGLFVHEPARELRALGHTVEVIAPLPHTPPLLDRFNPAWRRLAAVPRERELDGIRVRHPRYGLYPRRVAFAGSGRRMARAVAGLPDFDRYRGFDVIHAHAALPGGGAARRIAARLGLPFVVTSHGSDVVRGAAGRPAPPPSAGGPPRRPPPGAAGGGGGGGPAAPHAEIHDAFRAAAAVLAPSDIHLRRIAERGLPVTNARSFANGFDAATFLADAPAGSGRTPPTVVCVANLIPSKNLPRLLDAVADLGGRGRKLALHVIGDGPERDALKNRSRRLGLDARWSTALSRAELADALRAADVFALPARDESFGIVYLEAMAAGLPVIAPAGEGISSLIARHDAGLLTDPEDPSSLAAALERLAGEPDLRADLAQNALAAAKTLTWTEHARALAELYESVLRSDPSPAAGRGRVLHLLYNSEPDTNGYAVRSRYIMATQRELGWEPQAVTSPFQVERFGGGPRETAGGLLYHRLRLRGADRRRGRLGWRRYLVFLMKFLADRLLVGQTARIIRDERPDLLHAHSPAFNLFLARRAARRAGRRDLPLVYEVRGLTEETAIQMGNARSGSILYRMKRRIEERAMRAADAVVTISEGMRRDFGERGLDGTAIHLMPNGVDSERITPPERDEAFARRLGVEAGKVLGYIGTMGRLEGLPWLVERFAELPADWRLLLVGDGQDRPELLRLADALGVADRMSAPGAIPHEEVAAWYGLIDYLVIPRPSLRVTELVTPLKPLEGMAAGRIVFCSDIGGHREIVEENVNGFLFSRDDPAGFIEKVRGLSTAPAERRRLGEQARAWVRANRDWRALVANYEEIYLAANKAAKER